LFQSAIVVKRWGKINEICIVVKYSPRGILAVSMYDLLIVAADLGVPRRINHCVSFL